jgi:hypothetical protein
MYKIGGDYKKNGQQEIKFKLPIFCAHERNRTFTPLRMADFESAASTNSATWAALFFG